MGLHCRQASSTGPSAWAGPIKPEVRANTSSSPVALEHCAFQGDCAAIRASRGKCGGAVHMPRALPLVSCTLAVLAQSPLLCSSAWAQGWPQASLHGAPGMDTAHIHMLLAGALLAARRLVPRRANGAAARIAHPAQCLRACSAPVLRVGSTACTHQVCHWDLQDARGALLLSHGCGL